MITEEVTMVTERLLCGLVNTETLVWSIIIHVHGLSLPVAVALYAEMVVAVSSKGRQARTRFKHALSQSNTGRHA